MIKREANPKLTARWGQVLLAPSRWQEMHAILSRAPATAEYGWARQSSIVCKWRAEPAAVSAAAPPAAR
jgi:hypothetical protein